MSEKLPKELRGLVESLDKLTEGVVDEISADYEFDDPDQDDEVKLGRGYDQEPMTQQLEKVAQSEGDDIKNPVRTVVTDDGKEHMVLPAQATTLGVIARSDKIKPQIRAQFQKDIQTSAGLEYFLSDPQGHHFVKSQQIIQRFQEKYLGQ